MARQRLPVIAVLSFFLTFPLAVEPPWKGRAEEKVPEKKVVYFDSDFEGGSLDPFYPAHCDQGCKTPEITQEAARSGKHSVKMGTTSPKGWHSSLEFRWCNPKRPEVKDTPCNPALHEPTGLYQRFWIMLPQDTIDAVGRGKQVKLLLNRYDIDSNRRNKGGWWQTGFGHDFGSVPRNDLRTFEDSDLDPGTNVSTGVWLKGGVWYKVETWYRRDNAKGKGRAILWVNDKKVADSGWLRGMGRDEPEAQQSAWYGLVYARTEEPLVAYVDDVAAANYRLD